MQLKPYLLPLLQFAVIGPAIGVCIVVSRAVSGPAQLSGGPVVLLVLAGYAYGAVPALLAGLLFVLAWPARALARALTVREFGVLLGALAGVIAYALFRGYHGASVIPADWFGLAVPLVAGAVCGGVAAPARNATWDWVTVDVGAPIEHSDE
jgi:hypothetical protein